jgi:hypothetical protein
MRFGQVRGIRCWLILVWESQMLDNPGGGIFAPPSTDRQGSSGVEQRTHKPLVAGSIPALATSVVPASALGSFQFVRGEPKPEGKRP